MLMQFWRHQQVISASVELFFLFNCLIENSSTKNLMTESSDIYLYGINLWVTIRQLFVMEILDILFINLLEL